jgi:hypothetical protein
MHGDTYIRNRFCREYPELTKKSLYCIALLKRVQVTSIIIVTILGMPFADCSSSLNLSHSHTHFWNAIVPPELTLWKEERV